MEKVSKWDNSFFWSTLEIIIIKKKGYLFPDCAGIDCEACHKGKEKCGEKNLDAAGLNNLIIIIYFFYWNEIFFIYLFFAALVHTNDLNVTFARLLLVSACVRQLFYFFHFFWLLSKSEPTEPWANNDANNAVLMSSPLAGSITVVRGNIWMMNYDEWVSWRSQLTFGKKARFGPIGLQVANVTEVTHV